MGKGKNKPCGAELHIVIWTQEHIHTHTQVDKHKKSV